MTNRLGIEMLTLLGMPPVDHVQLAAELGCVSIWVAALPPDCEIGLEVPMIARFQAGMSARDHAVDVVAAARALGA
jgi:hypothetical protein